MTGTHDKHIALSIQSLFYIAVLCMVQNGMLDSTNHVSSVLLDLGKILLQSLVLFFHHFQLRQPVRGREGEGVCEDKSKVHRGSSVCMRS